MFRFTGFRDGHAHPLFAEREGAGPDVTGLKTTAAVVDAIANYLDSNPNCTWADCGSFSPGLEMGSKLTRELLDVASPTVPIVVHAEDHHSIWVNSAALGIAGFSDSGPELEHGRFEVDALGRPTGRIFEWEAMSLIYAHQPAPSLEADLQALQRAQERLLAAGVVSIQDAWIDRGMELPYLEAARTGQLKLRVNLAVRVDAKQWREDLAFAKSVRSATREIANPLLTTNTVKVFIDGVIGAKTAYLLEPYADGSNGRPLWRRSDLLEACLAADSAGFQLHFHAIGDAAVGEALHAIEHVSLINGEVDRRPVIAHADLIDPSSYPRLRSHGVVACVQPAWAVPGPALNEATETLGHERSERLYPLRGLLDSGVLVSFGSDWPVSPPEPLSGLMGATLRSSSPAGLEQHSAAQAIGRREALHSYSVMVAHQLGQETLLHEDEVVFDTDLANCTPEQLNQAKVLRVSVAGRQVWP